MKRGRRMKNRAVVLVMMMVTTMILTTRNVEGHPSGDAHKRHKLLYIMLDGFRWDYTEDQPGILRGFERFLREGVRARWVNPLFPSISYPSWTTLVTGQYAETHGIVGNYFYSAEDEDKFSLFDSESTGKEKWWTSEPIWTTATREGIQTALIFWSRCDVAFKGIHPKYCEHFIKAPGPEIFRTNINKALEFFKDGYDFVQVYTEHVDMIGHNRGPDTEERKQAVREFDVIIEYLQDKLEEKGIADETNIVIVSDHGMTNTAPGHVTRLEIDDYLDTNLVANIADRGAFMNIKVPSENVEKVYERLKTMGGVDVYLHDDIPERLHFRDNKYIHDILIKAKFGYFIMPSKDNAKQLPERFDKFVFYGAHGYDPELQDMKGIFFAKGPDFEKDLVIDPIEIVDIYQVLAHVLNVDPQPHNGTWAHVRKALVSTETQETYEVAGGGGSRQQSVVGGYMLLMALLTLVLV
ncbi:glycerophosphocholine cholinephosphodiesterase ENPP6-like [Oratosquilla oratoria]|uniref:glycerophosphocholine cholinephosphodiesterase ENPP6-like n=1 Tax=Oratosquilla oratoria TaxID=337810 RepID=UPI003F76F677